MQSMTDPDAIRITQKQVVFRQNKKPLKSWQT